MSRYCQTTKFYLRHILEELKHLSNHFESSNPKTPKFLTSRKLDFFV